MSAAKHNPAKRISFGHPKPRNPAKAKGVSLISRKGATIKKNPTESTPYHVQEKGFPSGTWQTLSKCTTAAVAKFLATHYAKHHPTNSFRVVRV